MARHPFHRTTEVQEEICEVCAIMKQSSPAMTPGRVLAGFGT